MSINVKTRIQTTRINSFNSQVINQINILRGKNRQSVVHLYSYFFIIEPVHFQLVFVVIDVIRIPHVFGRLNDTKMMRGIGLLFLLSLRQLYDYDVWFISVGCVH